MTPKQDGPAEPELNPRVQIIRTLPPFHSPSQHLESFNYSKGIFAQMEIKVPNGRAELGKREKLVPSGSS